MGSWFRNPGAGVAASTSAGGGGGKYITARTAVCYDATGNATAVEYSSKKRKVKVLFLVCKFPLKAHRI